jgi:(4-(4-[2-(gamma-L-glutamylamino)ethyl]phenoxymethyl)furan-2-yl)methanamine synthase
LVSVLGFDIGGANTKVTFLKTENTKIKELITILEYFPIWKSGKNSLPKILEKLKKKLANSKPLDGIGVTITAELSDEFMTKKEGIIHILDCLCLVFTDIPIFVLNVETNLVSVEEAKKTPLMVASANWAATGWITKQIIKDCIVVDVGSTSTSIIPIVNGEVAAEGRTDLEKLQNGELVYSGVLRTNVATIVNRIMVHGNATRVSSELFAQTGDVHLVLNNITEDEYTSDTCDGRGKTHIGAAARLARVVCADLDILNEQEIIEMAKFLYQKQIVQIANGLKQVKERVQNKKNIAVVTGIGRKFLARKAAEYVGFEEINDMNELVGADVAVASPSVGVAFMAVSKLEGKTPEWKRF